MSIDDSDILYFGDPDDEPHRPGPGDDPAVQDLEPKLSAFFEERPHAVFYESQLAITFEDEFFHWVTVRALRDLRERSLVGSELVKTDRTTVRFYFHRRHRYWKRQANATLLLMQEYSDPKFSSAIGQHGEMLVDQAMARFGFQWAAQNVNAWQGRRWTQSNHDLDRIYVRDGIAYGVEIKNKLGYIDQDEFRIKLAMMLLLDVRPLFIARMMPRTYIVDVAQAGGFSLLLGKQLYPFGSEELMKRVRQELGLPVDSPRALWDTTMQRLLDNHKRWLMRSR